MDKNNSDITCISVGHDEKIMYIGTRKGDVNLYSITAMKVQKFSINEEFIVHNFSPKRFYTRLGSVEIVEHSSQTIEKLLIGYSCGVIVIWDIKRMTISAFLSRSDELYSACWDVNGSMLVTSHSNGLICCWSPAKKSDMLNDIFTSYSAVPFKPRGSSICHPIKKIIWIDPFFIYSGGLPHSVSLDKNIISIMTGGTIKSMIELGSKIIDFFLIPTQIINHDIKLCENSKKTMEWYIVILTEQELVIVDLDQNSLQLQLSNTPSLPNELKQVFPSHLCCMNFSSITATTIHTNIPTEIWNKLLHFSITQREILFSHSAWPLLGGVLKKREGCADSINNNLLITGHEDGSVVFWNISNYDEPRLLYKLSTFKYYISDYILSANRMENDSMLPMDCFLSTKIGLYDPYTDDPRYCIQKICLYPKYETLLIGGGAGNILMFKFNDQKYVKTPPTYSQCNLMQKYPNFNWKGHESLKLLEENVQDIGFILIRLISIFPPSPVSTLNCSMEWNLVSIGTCYGFLIFDCFHNKTISSTCTFEIVGSASSGENIQRNSFLRSLRNSFKRISRKNKKSSKSADNYSVSSDDNRIELTSGNGSFRKRIGGGGSGRYKRGGDNNSGTAYSTPLTSTQCHRSWEVQKFESMATESSRFVGGKKIDPNLKGLVRSLIFVVCPILNSNKMKPVLIAATNYGKIYIQNLIIPSDDKRYQESVSVDSTKIIQMSHKAPIINMEFIDKTGTLHTSLSLSSYLKQDTNYNHFILCCTEEQIKIINLATMKTKTKIKITATEGNRLRKAVSFTTNIKPILNDIASRYLACFTSSGRLLIYSLVNLKCLKILSLFNKDDIVGINSTVLSQMGIGFNQSSFSEFQFFTIPTKMYFQPKCILHLKKETTSRCPSALSPSLSNDMAASCSKTLEYDDCMDIGTF